MLLPESLSFHLCASFDDHIVSCLGPLPPIFELNQLRNLADSTRSKENYYKFNVYFSVLLLYIYLYFGTKVFV